MPTDFGPTPLRCRAEVRCDGRALGEREGAGVFVVALVAGDAGPAGEGVGGVGGGGEFNLRVRVWR